MVNINLLNSKDEMTKLERVNATLNFEETDRICTYDILRNVGIIEYFSGKKLKNINHRKENLILAGKAIKNCFDLYRPECLWAPNYPHIEKTEDGLVIQYSAHTQWLAHRPFNNVKQLKEWVKINIEDLNNKWNPNERYSFWGRVKLGDTNYKDYIESFQKLVGDTVLWHIPSSVGLDVANELASINLFTELYFDYPDLASNWLEALNMYELKRIKYIAERYSNLSPLVLIYTDLAYKCGLIYSPAFLRKEFFSRLKRLNDAWHEYGVKCIYHSDGNFMEVMDDFIEAGIDGVQSIEPLSGWDLIDIRSKYPDLILVGNLDASQLLPYGSVDDIKRAVKKAIDEIYPSGGFIISSCTELHPAIPPENGIIMILFAREYSRLKSFKEREINEIKINL